MLKGSGRFIKKLLQVFDSGSSCSNEECWGGDEKGVRKCDKTIEDIDKRVNASHTKISDVKNLPISSKVCDSAISNTTWFIGILHPSFRDLPNHRFSL